MKAHRLADWPNNPTPTKRPLCQHDVQIVGDWANSARHEWHEKGVRRYKHLDRPAQCTFPAVVELDGVPLCRRHAGQVALDYVLAHQEKEAT